jgi:hypothetical protein
VRPRPHFYDTTGGGMRAMHEKEEKERYLNLYSARKQTCQTFQLNLAVGAMRCNPRGRRVGP